MGEGVGEVTGTRKNVAAAAGSLTARGLVIADVVREVGDEVGHSPAQVALAWTLLDSAVTSTIMGVRTLAQLEDNLGALDVALTDDQRARLDAVSAVDLGFPHDMLRRPMTRGVVFGGATIAPRA